MITNLDNIVQVFKILSKSLSNKYPYLGEIQIQSINDETGNIRINLYLDLNKFIEDNKLKLRYSAEKMIINGDIDDNYFQDRKVGFLNTWIQDDVETDNRFGFRINDEIEKYLSDMMDMLPTHIIPIHKHEGTQDTYDYPINLYIMNFIIKFDSKRYLNYIKQ